MPIDVPVGALNTLRALPGDLRALLGVTGAMFGLGAASTLYGNLIRGRTDAKSEVRNVFRKLRKAMGLDTDLHYVSPDSRAAARAPYYMPELPRSVSAIPGLREGVHALSAAPGELAHELGHARAHQNPVIRALNTLQPLRRPANIATFPAAVFLTRPGVPPKVKAFAVAALSVPGVADVLDESIASGIGSIGLYKLRRALGSSIPGAAVKSLSTFSGLPTYMLNAAFPAAGVGLGGHMRKLAAEELDEAPEGWCWGVRWADGRALICFRKKSQAQAFFDSGQGHNWFEAVGDGPKLLDNRRKGKNGQILKGQNWSVRNKATTFKCSGKDCEHPSHNHQEKEAYDYSSVQFNLPLDLGWKVWRWGQDHIDPEDLYTDPESPDEYGFSDEPHITLQYGFHNARSMYVARRLRREHPVVVQIGPTSLFRGEDYDVLKLDVSSPDLHRLRPISRKRLVYTETYPEYHPHVTIAYLKKGKGKKYVGETVVPEDPVVLTEAVFSSKNGSITRIPLTEPREETRK